MKPVKLGHLAVRVFGGWREIGGNQVLLETEEEASSWTSARPSAAGTGTSRSSWAPASP